MKCGKCGYHFDFPAEGSKHSGFCHSCAHSSIAEAHGWIESFTLDPEKITREDAIRELTRLHKCFSACPSESRT